MGAATYTIPIEVVPGTQGMQPNLSIVYNSMGGMGLLGMKWNLTGLSAITRCGQTPYYDDKTTAIQFNINDRFAFNGERLIRLNSGDYESPGGEYTTEAENFTRVISYTGEYQSLEFKAYPDDGSIIEYGHTFDSKQILALPSLNNPVLSWYVSNITDANGNNMTFEYELLNGEICIQKIEYTGNAEIRPYAKVEFAYITNTLNPNTYFVGGWEVQQTKLLETITVSYKDTIVRQYKFNYNLNDSGASTAHLKEIVLRETVGSGNTHFFSDLNSTTIKWGESNINSDQIRVTLNHLPYERFITGDFNGDGYLDYVVYGLGTSKNIWELYTAIPGTVEFQYVTQGTHQQLNYYPTVQSCYFYAADLDGDGCDELIIAERASTGVNNVSFRIVFTNSDEPVTISKTFNNFSEVFFGDFDGDGSTDILFLQNDGGTYSFYFFMHSRFDEDTIFRQTFSPCRVRVGGFYGDGKSKIEVLTLDTRLIYTYNYSHGSLWGEFSSSAFPYVTTVYDRYSGDFNGDGITDLLTYENVDAYTLSWKLSFGKGDGTFTTPTTINSPTLNTETISIDGRVFPKHKILIADVNGDGKDDIIQPIDLGNYTYLTVLKIIYSEGYVSDGYVGQYQYTSTSDTILGDFQGLDTYHLLDINRDGILDIMIRDTMPNIYHRPTVMYLYKNKQYEFVKEITDGMGKTIKLNYTPKIFLAESRLNLSGGFSESYFKNYFLYLINNVQIPNGLEQGFYTLTYTFNDAAFSLRKKSFLGFRSFSCFKNSENKRDLLLYDFDPYVSSGSYFYGNRDILIPLSHSSFVNSQTISHTVYSNEIKTIRPFRYIHNFEGISTNNWITNSETLTINVINSDGRLIESNTKTYDNAMAPSTDWILSETKTFTYNTITLNGYQKKTVPQKIITSQQYGYYAVPISDTVIYNYYEPGTNKGRLAWERKGNLDGSITTAYEDYTPSGLCIKHKWALLKISFSF
jgi:hypothetical protein